jgi:hypothetical protein
MRDQNPHGTPALGSILVDAGIVIFRNQIRNQGEGFGVKVARHMVLPS